MSDVDFGAIASAAIDKITATDTQVATPEPELPSPAPEGTAEAPVVDTPTAAGVEVDTPDVYDDDKVQQFDRDYVTKLREKEDRYRRERNEERERWQEWNTTLDGLDAEQQGLARELVASILQGDLERAAEIIGRDQLAEVLGTAAPSPAVAEPAPAEAPLTRADLEREFAEREKAREAQQQMDAVLSEAKGLGYNPDAKPGSPDFGRWVMVVQYAQANGGSLEAGHKALQAAEAAERQRIIDDYVSSRSNGSPAPVAPGGVPAREPDGAWLENGNPIQNAMRRAMDRVAGDHSQIG